MTKKKETLKMFVWEDVLTDWTPGLMVALAHNVEEAREMLLNEDGYIPEDDRMKEPKVYETPKAVLVWGGG